MKHQEKQYKKQISYRILITGILIILEFLWLFFMIFGITSVSTIAAGVFKALSIIYVIYITNKDLNPSYKIAWIIPILIFPIPGAIFYLIFGDSMPKNSLRRKLNDIYLITEQYKRQDERLSKALKSRNPRLASTSTYLSRLGYPSYANTNLNYYPSGEKMFSDMMQAMSEAEHYIFFEYFIVEEGIMWNRMLELLHQKVQEGVEVRMIYDDIGSLSKIPGDYYRKIEELGIQVLRFNPLIPFLAAIMNHRDHRKILVVDGHTAFTGGINLADEYINVVDKLGYWKDTGIRIKGDAVWSFTLMFLEMWNAHRHDDLVFENFLPTVYGERQRGQGLVQPYSCSPLDKELISENIYMEIINQSMDYLYIMTPYLILDNEMKSALCLAAKRGVDVRIITPGIPDKPMIYRQTRSNYRRLMEAGVKIYEFRPGFIHAKSFVSDDRVGVVGTINLDYRSLYLHFECATLFADCQAVMDLRQDSIETLSKSKRIINSDIKKGPLSRAFDAVMTLFAPLF